MKRKPLRDTRAKKHSKPRPRTDEEDLQGAVEEEMQARKVHGKKKHGAKKLPAAVEAYRADFEKWQEGTPLAAIARALNSKRRPVKLAFLALAGSRDAFKALREAGAGGKAFGGATGGGRTREAVLHDDSKVKTLHSSPKWKIEILWEPCVVTIKGDGKFAWRKEKLRMFISPKGNKYVQARDMEKADLIVLVRQHSVPNKEGETIRLPNCDSKLRLKRLKNSSVLKKLKKEDDVVARGLKARAAKKKAKKMKKKHLARLAK